MQRAKRETDAGTFDDQTTSERVVQAVADRGDVEPTAIGEPLFAAVDPDALDALVRSTDDGTGRSSVRVEFSYYGYDVLVSSDGPVHLAECE